MATKQTQIAKPAAKTAAKKTMKPAAAPGAKFFLRDGGARPGSGRLLFAYTAAWLQEAGLVDGGSISREDAVKFAGATAVTYHTTKTNWMHDKGGRITLTNEGANKFFDRAHSEQDRETYREIIRTGKPDGKLVKNQTAIGTLQAAQ